MGRGSPFLLSLGYHSKQAGDEGDLPGDVSFAHSSHLSLANHVHDLIPLQRSPCRFQGKEAHPWLDQALDKAMVLLDQVVRLLTCLSSTRSGRIAAALALPWPWDRPRSYPH